MGQFRKQISKSLQSYLNFQKIASAIQHEKVICSVIVLFNSFLLQIKMNSMVIYLLFNYTKYVLKYKCVLGMLCVLVLLMTYSKGDIGYEKRPVLFRHHSL